MIEDILAGAGIILGLVSWLVFLNWHDARRRRMEQEALMEMHKAAIRSSVESMEQVKKMKGNK